MTKNNTRIFRVNKLKNLLLFIGTLAFVAMGIFLLDKDPFIAWATILFFGLGLLVSLIHFHPNATYLKLNEEGFEVKGLFRSSFTQWSEVKDFRLGQINGNKMIFFNYTNKHKKWRRGKKIAKLLSGNEGAISSNYKILTKDLIQLMQDYKKNSKMVDTQDF